ncbi:sugar uptake ABC transporter permease protein, partial [human gut metagenome]
LKVVLPMSRSSVGVAGLMAFLFSWNEFMFALSLTSTKNAQTLTVGIAGYVTSFQTFWGSMSATGILFMIPAFILTFIFQKDLVKGLTAGAVKG